MLTSLRFATWVFAQNRMNCAQSCFLIRLTATSSTVLREDPACGCFCLKGTPYSDANYMEYEARGWGWFGRPRP
jgi:hypothetical protein